FRSIKGIDREERVMKWRNSEIDSNFERGLNIIVRGLLVLLLFPVISAHGQNTQTTSNKADQNIKSSIRVNPITLAMEFTLPLAGYPGRGGNSKSITLDYSSKVWNMKKVNSRFESQQTSHQDYEDRKSTRLNSSHV